MKSTHVYMCIHPGLAVLLSYTPPPVCIMPYGASPKEFTLTVLAALLSAAAGSSLVHAIMKPDEAPVDFSGEVEARSRAIREMQAQLGSTFK